MSFSKLKKKRISTMKGVFHLWNAMITSYMCTEHVKTLHTAALSNVESQCLLI